MQAEVSTPDTSKIKMTFKHNLEVSRNWKDIIILDSTARNTRWQQVVEKEVGALIQHKCFDFKTPDYKSSTD